MMTATGDVWVTEQKHMLIIYMETYILRFLQDPPEEIVQNCTKEVDEVLR